MHKYRRTSGMAALIGLLAVTSVQAQPAPMSPPPTRILIYDVLLQGNRTISSAQIMAQLRTRPGRDFDEAVLQEDVRNLMATKQFANVASEVVPAGADRVKVTFHFRDYPSFVQRVVYQGAKHLKDDELDQLTHIRRGMPCSPTQNKLGCQAIVARLNEDGRPFAQCELLSGDKQGDTEVVFNITEGPKVAVAAIEFVGNSFVSATLLRQHIHTMRKVFGLGGFYNGAMADGDEQKLQDYYRAFGYLDVHVSRELQWQPNGRDVTLVFHIQEGPRYRLLQPPQIHRKYASSVPVEELERLSTLKESACFNKAAAEADLQRIKDCYGYQGREVAARWVPVFYQDRPGWIDLRYEIEGPTPAGRPTRHLSEAQAP
jgi:outer membrane protein insertion porin family